MNIRGLSSTASLIAAAWIVGCSADLSSDATLPSIAWIDPETDPRFGVISQLTEDSCDVIVYDNVNRKVARIGAGSREARLHGSYGDGPGEFRHVRGLVRGRDGIVTLQDWVRRQFVRVDLASGRAISIEPADELTRYGLIGKIRMLADGSMADYWLADGLTTVAISPDDLGARPLIIRLDTLGKWTSDGWGRMEPAPMPNTVRLHRALQEGDLAVLGDTLFALRSPLGRIEVYAAPRPSRQPIRVINLHSYSVRLPAREQR